MDTQKERDLVAKGYKFSGVYTRDLGEAKARANEYRLNGYFATVSTKSYEGRIYNTIGHSVYIKEKVEK